MYKFQNHIEVLESIKELRERLPEHRDSHLGQCEIMTQLATLYACLDVREIQQIVADFKVMNRRASKRVVVRKKVA